MRTSSALLAALAGLASFTQAAPALRNELQQVLQDVDRSTESVIEEWKCGDDVGAEKKKEKTKTKTKYKTSILTSLSTTTTTTTVCSSSSKSHEHLPPIIQPPHTHTESSSHSSTSKAKGTTITITPTATSTNTKISLPPVITATSSSSSSKHKHKTTTITPSPTSTKTSVHLPPVIPPPGTSSKSSTASPTSTSVSGIIPTGSTSASASPTNKPLTSKRTRKALKKAGIIPSVIGDFKPSFLLETFFLDDEEDILVDGSFLGQNIPTEDVQNKPAVRLVAPERKGNYGTTSYPPNNIIITLTDPDAPSHSNPKWSEMCHWISIGVPVDVEEGSSIKGVEPLKDIVEFKPPGPPPHTGKHRYVLLAFMPKNATTEPLHLSVPSERQHWGYGSKGHGVKDWAEDNGLLQIAGDYFVAEHE